MVQPLRLIVIFALPDEHLMLQRVCGALERLQAQRVTQAPRLLRFLDGSAWPEEAMVDLASEALVLPLLSRTLLELDLRHPERLASALALHQRGLSRVLPTIIRPCEWRASRFAALAPLSPIPADERPLELCSDVNAALAAVDAGARAAAAWIEASQARTAASTQMVFSSAPALTLLASDHAARDAAGLAGSVPLQSSVDRASLPTLMAAAPLAMNQSQPAPRRTEVVPEPPRAIAQPAVDQSSPRRTAVVQDQRIGSYILRAMLDRGGMGEVWSAEHATTGKKVAVKFLLADLARDPRFRDRFLTEARTMGHLGIQGIVQVHDCDTAPDGRLYLVMEFLEGTSLRRRIEQGISPAHAVVLCRQLAAVLAQVHEKGIIHRDLKPENLMLIPDAAMSDGERVKILDFGIAKVIATEVQRQGQGTAIHEVMGTPSYMAPEQWLSTTQVDDKADVYAVGIMLYEMLAGRTPFADRTTRESLAYAHLQTPPPALRELPGPIGRAQAGPRRAIPAALEQLVLAMLAKDPTTRPSMGAVAAALAAPDLLQENARRRSLRVAVPLGAATLALVAVAASVSWWTRSAPVGATVGRLGAVGERPVSGAAVVHNAPTGAPALPASQAPPRAVRCFFNSTPRGAAVLLDGVDTPLCQTPCNAELTLKEGGVSGRYERADYQPGRFLVRLNEDRGCSFEVNEYRLREIDVADPQLAGSR